MKNNFTTTISHNENNKRIKFNFDPSFSVWQERIFIYIQFLLQENVRQGNISYNFEFKISNFLKNMNMTPENRRQVYKSINMFKDTQFYFTKSENEKIFFKLFKIINLNRGVCYFEINKHYANNFLFDIQNNSYITLNKEFKNYKKSLSFKLARFLKSKTSLGATMEHKIILNDLKELLYGQHEHNWKYNQKKIITNEGKVFYRADIHFMNAILKPAIDEINKYSQLKITYPLNQRYLSNGEREITIRVSSKKEKIHKKELILIGQLQNNLKQYVNQIGLEINSHTFLPEGEILNISKSKIISENSMNEVNETIDKYEKNSYNFLKSSDKTLLNLADIDWEDLNLEEKEKYFESTDKGKYLLYIKKNKHKKEEIDIVFK